MKHVQAPVAKIARPNAAEFERTEKWDAALVYYRRAHAADHLAEEFYQRLMTCHHRLGQKSEAAGVYRLCRKMLFSGLGITPSRQTEEIYKTVELM